MPGEELILARINDHGLKSRYQYYINIVNISPDIANIIGLISYWIPQNTLRYCRYLSESADI